MIKTVWSLVTVIGICYGCSTRTNDTGDDSSKTNPDIAADHIEGTPEEPTDQRPPGKTVNTALRSGLYRGGLRLAINGNLVSGYYEDATGWDDETGGPRFSCEYSFSGEYTGSDTIPLLLSTDEGATGSLEILSDGKIRVTLSRSPCNNEQPVTEVWEIEKAYPLLVVMDVLVSRSYFFSDPNQDTPRSAYLVKGDRAEIMDISGEWYHVRYQGVSSTTEGWMPSSAFEDKTDKGESASVLGKWLSKPGEPYEVFYEFYANNRYKSWSFNSPEPQGMTGSFSVLASGIISLQPCGSSTVRMPFRSTGAGDLSFKLPQTDRWTAFERNSGHTYHENAVFSIENRAIVTTVNGRIIQIPSSAAKSAFLNVVCPFDVKADVINNGEGTFDILRVSSYEKGPLFYAVLDGDDVAALVIEVPTANWKGITVGTTFGELKKSFPSIKVDRSEVEGRIIGSNDHFSFSFGHLGNQLYDSNNKSIPDSVKNEQIIL